MFYAATSLEKFVLPIDTLRKIYSNIFLIDKDYSRINSIEPCGKYEYFSLINIYPIILCNMIPVTVNHFAKVTNHRLIRNNTARRGLEVDKIPGVNHPT